MNIVFVKTHDHQEVYYEQLREIYGDEPNHYLFSVLIAKIRLRKSEEAAVIEGGPNSTLSRKTNFALLAPISWIFRSNLFSKFVAKGKKSIFFYFMERLAYWYLAKKKVFARKPDLIVLCEDNCRNSAGVVTDMAHKRGVPFFVFPIYVPQPLALVKLFENDPAHATNALTRSVVGALSPAELLRFKNIQLVAHPIGQVVARWLLRQHRGQPWILNSGYARKVMVEGDATKENYLELGFKPNKIAVTGGLIDDELFRGTVDKRTSLAVLQKKIELDQLKPIVLCALPPNQYVGARDAFEYGSYRELCVGWLKSIHSISKHANVLVALHPRSHRGLVEELLPPNVHITDDPLQTSIVLADIYVACVSSTIRWALALGTPVINYDTYRYDYGDYANALGCLEVSSQQAFRQVLGQCLESESLSRLKLRAQSDAQNWGRIDGKVGERIRVCLDESLAGYGRGMRESHTHPLSFRLRDF